METTPQNKKQLMSVETTRVLVNSTRTVGTDITRRDCAGNSIGLARFRQAVQRVWWEWLGRRRGGNRPTWAKFLQFEQRWPLPPSIALHSVCRVRSKGVT